MEKTNLGMYCKISKDVFEQIKNAKIIDIGIDDSMNYRRTEYVIVLDNGKVIEFKTVEDFEIKIKDKSEYENEISKSED